MTVAMPPSPQVKPHTHALPLRVGTRGSPLALIQTRGFLAVLTSFCLGAAAVAGQDREEAAGLDQRQRRAAGADPQRQRMGVRLHQWRGRHGDGHGRVLSLSRATEKIGLFC